MASKLINNDFLQKLLIILLLAVSWESIARSGLFSPTVFPSFSAILNSFLAGILDGTLTSKTFYSLYLILKGLILASLIAVLLSSLAVMFPFFKNVVDVLNTILHPLPGVALLPIAILWFGIGEASIIFIIVHSVLWPMVLNFMTGFKAIPAVLLELGQTFGLRGSRLLWGIMLPSSLPYLLSGIKIGWARAWRSAIAVEMVFGAAAGTVGGLGWHIYMTRYLFDIAGTFAALLAIIIIGMLVEELLFRVVENATVKKWGMLSQGGYK